MMEEVKEVVSVFEEALEVIDWMSSVVSHGPDHDEWKRRVPPIQEKLQRAAAMFKEAAKLLEAIPGVPTDASVGWGPGMDPRVMTEMPGRAVHKELFEPPPRDPEAEGFREAINRAGVSGVEPFGGGIFGDGAFLSIREAATEDALEYVKTRVKESTWRTGTVQQSSNNC